MKNYVAYKSNYGKKEILFVSRARNKEEMRQLVLNSPKMQEIVSVRYGIKEYTMSDIYAGR